MKRMAICSTPVTGRVGPGWPTGSARLCLLVSLIPAYAASPVRLSGQLDGFVKDVAGKPQPGAIVVLLNRQDRLLQRSATDALGSFSFAELLPDFYSIQVSFASFVPAVKERIQIKPGMRSMLDVSLSRVFSSIQLISTTPVPNGLMSDSWKWVLRADSPTRPVLRLLPVQAPASSDRSSDAENPARGRCSAIRAVW